MDMDMDMDMDINLSPVSRARSLLVLLPRVALRSTRGFTLMPASRA